MHVVGSASPEALFGPRVSLDEWSQLPEDVPGEFVDGRLVEEEVPDYLHEVVVIWLARMIGNWGDERGIVVGGSEAKLAVTPQRGRKADLTVYLAGRRPLPRELVSTPPDIAVEVISSSPRDERRDREEKRLEYAAFGIRYYWLVDPGKRTFEIFALGSDRGYQSVVARTSGVVAIPGCDGLELDLDAMWVKVDALEGE